MYGNDNSSPPPPPRPAPEDELEAALHEGDLLKVRALVAAGANIRFKSEHGYDALLAAVHGRDVNRDLNLLDLLSFLVASQVDLNAISSYSESGLRVLSRIGRFDAVQLLLRAGADKSHLGWTPLMEAVAVGSLEDVRDVLAQGAKLEERDWWERTAWMISLLTGDIAKAGLLREAGADVNARGKCGCPPVCYPIQGHHPPMLRWLLEIGVDPHQIDDFGDNAVFEAAEEDDLECLEILLRAGVAYEVDATPRRRALIQPELLARLTEAGIDPEGIRRIEADLGADKYRTALENATSRDVIMRLLEAGADPAKADQRIILRLPEYDAEILAGASADEFHQTHARRFGVRNPERVDHPFWEAMIRSGATAYQARELFNAEYESLEAPVWCAKRFGQSVTLLPDGRVIQIAGEHEDAYDPDFCIYNDVFVHHPGGSIAIFCYPESEFPPTDFHTATLVGEFIYVIGSLGYLGSRKYGTTPVYRLDLKTMRMDLVKTSGESPGWIHKHRAVAEGEHVIRVWGGKVLTEPEDWDSNQPPHGSFILDLGSLVWRRER